MADQKIYHAPDVDIEGLSEVLSSWFEGQGLGVQVLDGPQGDKIVQARQPEGEKWKKFIGLSKALNVTLIPQGENLVVEMGAADWIDKAVVGGVGALIFWPAIIPAAFGAWKQYDLPKKTFQVIDQYIATGQAPVAPVPGRGTGEVAPVGLTCPSCGKPVEAGMKFCPYCGEALQRTCPKCGQVLSPGAKFCPNCGAKVSD